MPQLVVAKQRVLFLSTRNAARSLIAEAWLSRLGGDRFEVQSAGITPAPNIDPTVVQAMREVDVDMSLALPKSSANLRGPDFDIVIIICPREGEVEPSLPGAGKVLRWSCEDPARTDSESPEQRVGMVRRLRGESLTRAKLFMNATIPSVPQR
jgi:arsenate reductase